MKKFLAVLLLTLSSTLSLASSSGSVTMVCDGMTVDTTLLLMIRDGKLVQVREQSQGSLPRVLMTNLIGKDQYSSIYSVLGTPSILTIDNAVLDGNNGSASIDRDRFDCSQQ